MEGSGDLERMMRGSLETTRAEDYCTRLTVNNSPGIVQVKLVQFVFQQIFQVSAKCSTVHVLIGDLLSTSFAIDRFYLAVSSVETWNKDMLPVLEAGLGNLTSLDCCSKMTNVLP